MQQALHESALEDDFHDIISKASRGLDCSHTDITHELDVRLEDVVQWFAGEAIPDAAKTFALARILCLDEQALLASSRRAWHPHILLPQHIESYVQFSQPHSNGYLLRSHDMSEIALVDPAGNAEHLVKRADATGLPLRYLLVTHRHNDHADAVASLLQKAPHLELIMHPLERQARPELAFSTHTISDHEQLAFGNDTIEILFTPGHTDGSICFHYGNAVFVGDTLFAGSIGRTFGPTTNYQEHLAHIRARILTLPDDVIILPGHGPSTSIVNEKTHNPFLHGRQTE